MTRRQARNAGGGASERDRAPGDVPPRREEPAPDAVPAVDSRLLVREEGIRGYLGEFRRKLRSGELGSLARRHRP
ncbi:hypothetical protein STANM309S_06515 [Streptomyces tanashiensis]